MNIVVLHARADAPSRPDRVITHLALDATRYGALRRGLGWS
jgi:predicted SpoU family rRNA methylase